MNITTLHEFRRCLEAGAVDILQPSVAKVGGVTPMLEIIALARVFSILVAPHSFYWGPAYLATAHVVALMGEPCPVETAFITLEQAPDPRFDPGTPSLVLNEAPGLAFDPGEDFLKQYLLARTEVPG